MSISTPPDALKVSQTAASILGYQSVVNQYAGDLLSLSLILSRFYVVRILMPYSTRLLLERAQSIYDSSLQPRSSRTSAIVNVYTCHRFPHFHSSFLMSSSTTSPYFDSFNPHVSIIIVLCMSTGFTLVNSQLTCKHILY